MRISYYGLNGEEDTALFTPQSDLYRWFTDEHGTGWVQKGTVGVEDRRAKQFERDDAEYWKDSLSSPKIGRNGP